MTVSRQPVAMSELAAQLRALGVPEGGVLLVHTSFSRIGAVENGPLGLIGALQAVLGPTGTLVMPSMTDEDDHCRDGEGLRTGVMVTARRP